MRSKIGYLGMSHLGNQENSNQSQFFITLRTDDMEHLKKEYTIFGEIAEGTDVLITLNELYCDEDGRPYQDVRIQHTYVLDDPFPNPPNLRVPDASPERERPEEEKVKARIPYEPPKDPNDPSSAITTSDGRTEDEIMESIRQKEAKSRAIVLEMTGDLPDADVKPPDEVLFVCKLNPVTRDEDLEMIFSRFGKIKSCEIIRDYKTGDSLNYAFIEFEKQESCIEAYEKMNNALIDDRRIKVDFSQSVSKLWNRFLLRPRNNLPKKENSHLVAPQPRRRPEKEDSGQIESKEKTNSSGPPRGNDYAQKDRGNRDKPRDEGKRSRDRQSRDRRKDRDDRDSRREREEDKGRDRDRSRDRRDKDKDRDRDRDRDDDRRKDRERSRDRRNTRDSSRDKRDSKRTRSNSRDRYQNHRDRDRR